MVGCGGRAQNFWAFSLLLLYRFLFLFIVILKQGEASHLYPLPLLSKRIMENKLKLERFFVLVLFSQIFKLQNLADSIACAKSEIESEGIQLKFRYSEDYVSRKLQTYPYQFYKRSLLKKLAYYEKDITPTIAEII